MSNCVTCKRQSLKWMLESSHPTKKLIACCIMRIAKGGSVPPFALFGAFGSSAKGDRSDRRASAPLKLHGLHDEGELVHLLCCKLIELQVLKKMHSVHNERNLVYG